MFSDWFCCPNATLNLTGRMPGSSVMSPDWSWYLSFLIDICGILNAVTSSPSRLSGCLAQCTRGFSWATFSCGPSVHTPRVDRLMSPSGLDLRPFQCTPFSPSSPKNYFLFLHYCLYISHRKNKREKIHSLVCRPLCVFLPQKARASHKEPANIAVFYHKNYADLLWLPISMALIC